MSARRSDPLQVRGAAEQAICVSCRSGFFFLRGRQENPYYTAHDAKLCLRRIEVSDFTNIIVLSPLSSAPRCLLACCLLRNSNNKQTPHFHVTYRPKGPHRRLRGSCPCRPLSLCRQRKTQQGCFAALVLAVGRGQSPPWVDENRSTMSSFTLLESTFAHCWIDFSTVN